MPILFEKGVRIKFMCPECGGNGHGPPKAVCCYRTFANGECCYDPDYETEACITCEGEGYIAIDDYRTLLEFTKKYRSNQNETVRHT